MLLITRQKEIMKFLLLQSSWVKGSVLAQEFNVTTRTIRNDIKKINEFKNLQIILSSSEGYKIIDNFNCKEYLDDNYMPISPKERVNYILNKLLTTLKPIDLYDISEEIFVSLSTLEKDLKQIKDIVKNYNLKIDKKFNTICIKGDEKNKRQLIRNLLYVETDGNFLNLDNYENIFEDFDLNLIKEIFIDTFNSYNLYANDYSITSMVIHVAIILTRIRNNYILNSDENNYLNIKKYREYEICKEIIERLEKTFNVKFPQKEIYYLTFLIMGKATLNYSTINKFNLKDFIEPSYIKLVDNILLKVNNYYFLDLNNEEFYIKFIIHTKNMLFRIKNNTYTKNPMNKNIKITYPFIYEVAVFISNEIYINTGLKIPEDEMGYIAIHIGAALERNKILNSKIKTVLICPKYHDIHLRIIRKLKERYSDSIEITDVLTLVDNTLNKLSANLIISTTNIERELNSTFIKINPLLTHKDYLKIDFGIEKIINEKNISIVKKYINKCFDRDLFFKNIYYDNEFEIIRFLGEKLLNKKLANDNFVDLVIKREKLSSTTFLGNNFAIPHSIETDSKKTVISVLVNDDKIKWGNNYINMVLLIAVNKKDRRDFMELYESLIDVLCKKENVDLLVASNNYEEFMSHIAELIYING